MKDVQRALRSNTHLSTVGFDWDKELAKIVWKKFYEARDQGRLKVKVWFVTVDFSDELASLLTKWFGTDPAMG